MSAPRRPVGLRRDQAAAWEQHAADQYGGPDRNLPADPADIDPGWLAEATRARELARQNRP